LLAVFLIIFAHPLVRVILGEKWLPMVSPLRILAVFGVLRSLLENARPIFFSKGDFKTIALLDAARTAVLALLIFPLISWYQTSGAALAVLISLVAIFPWLVIKVRKIL
jgi:O-antigen/teichoic acid export membrane protein